MLNHPAELVLSDAWRSRVNDLGEDLARHLARLCLVKADEQTVDFWPDLTDFLLYKVSVVIAIRQQI